VKYTVYYGRKVRIAEYDMLEVGLSQEFDDSVTAHDVAFAAVREKVDSWIEREIARIRELGRDPQSSKLTIDSVSKMIPLDLRKDLFFEEDGDHILIRSRKYLGQEAFRRIAEIAESLGGEYVSAGKDSHFKIPKRRGDQQ